MFNTNNPYQNTDIKAYYRNFYFQNKLLVYLMAASLIVQLIAGSGFFDIVYYIYLIYFGGYVLKQYLGEQRVLLTYIISGVLGLLAIPLLFGEIEGILNLSLGAFAASASLGLLAAAATYVPNMEVQLMLFGRVKIKWIALVLIGMDLMSIFSPIGQYRIAHLGGIAYGFISIIMLKQGGGFQFENPFASMFKRKGPYYKKSQNTANSSDSTKRSESDEDYNARKNNEQEEIDRILDKVKQKGYAHLSAEEKQKLFDKGNNG